MSDWKKPERTVVYNMKSLPEGVSVEEVLEIYAGTGVLLYEGAEPLVIDSANVDHDIVIIEVEDKWLVSR